VSHRILSLKRENIAVLTLRARERTLLRMRLWGLLTLYRCWRWAATIGIATLGALYPLGHLVQ
jgi:hypothetical protein